MRGDGIHAADPIASPGGSATRSGGRPPGGDGRHGDGAGPGPRVPAPPPPPGPAPRSASGYTDGSSMSVRASATCRSPCSSSPAGGHAEQPTRRHQRQRLGPQRAADVAGPGAEAAQHPELSGALDHAHRDRVDEAEHADADDEQAHQALHGEDGVEALLLVGPLDVGALDVEGVAAGAEGVVHRQRRAVDGVVVGRGRRTGTRALDRHPQLARGVGGCSRRRRQRRPRAGRRPTPRRGWPSRCRPPRRRGGRRRWST